MLIHKLCHIGVQLSNFFLVFVYSHLAHKQVEEDKTIDPTSKE